MISYVIIIKYLLLYFFFHAEFGDILHLKVDFIFFFSFMNEYV